MNSRGIGCDLLVVSPHTDDLEIGLGGMVAALAQRGRSIWAVDLTRGELGSNATPDQRWAEATASSEVLKLTGRLQLDLPDGFINPTDRDHLSAVVWALRVFRPRLLVSAPEAVRHPDHVATASLVRKAAFLARLVELEVSPPTHRIWPRGAALPTVSESWITPQVAAVCADEQQPDFLFDVSDHWVAKQEALKCYASQFVRSPGRRQTMINDQSFLDKIERRARTWGRRADCRFAEAFRTTATPVYDDLPTGWVSR